MTAEERLDQVYAEKKSEFVAVNKNGETCIRTSHPEQIAQLRALASECPEARIVEDTGDMLKVVFPEDEIELLAPPEEDEE